MDYEAYEVTFESWPGVTLEARDKVQDQLTGCTTNGSPSFDEVDVSLVGDVLRVRVVVEATDPLDALDIPSGILDDVLHELSPQVFQSVDHERYQEHTWCAKLSVRHFEFVEEERELIRSTRAENG